jgi:hypothetical protein
MRMFDIDAAFVALAFVIGFFIGNLFCLVLMTMPYWGDCFMGQEEVYAFLRSYPFQRFTSRMIKERMGFENRGVASRALMCLSKRNDIGVSLGRGSYTRYVWYKGEKGWCLVWRWISFCVLTQAWLLRSLNWCGNPRREEEWRCGMMVEDGFWGFVLRGGIVLFGIVILLGVIFLMVYWR